jgi:hypothetical protein
MNDHADSGSPRQGEFDALRVSRGLDAPAGSPERTELDAACASDPAVAAERAEQERVDESLRAYFTPTRSAASGRARTVRTALAGLAAMVAIGFAVWTLVPPRAPVHPPMTLAAVYTSQIAQGFVPMEVCTDEVQFAQWTRRAVGQPLRPAGLDAGVELVGWTYAYLPERRAGVLLARVEGTPVVVVMARGDVPGDEPFAAASPEVRVFRRTLAGVTMFEVTPGNRSRVIEHLEQAPDPPPEPPREGY